MLKCRVSVSDWPAPFPLLSLPSFGYVKLKSMHLVKVWGFSHCRGHHLPNAEQSHVEVSTQAGPLFTSALEQVEGRRTLTNGEQL